MSSETTDLKINFGNTTGFKVEDRVSDISCNWLLNSCIETTIMDCLLCIYQPSYWGWGCKNEEVLDPEALICSRQKHIIKTNKL